MSPSPFEEKRLVMVALIGVANVSNKIAVVATQQDLVEVEGFVMGFQIKNFISSHRTK